MDFRSLQENLRQLLLRRVRAGQLTGMELAREAGFRQPHISNFLNLKRSLSLQALDRVLSVQRLSVLDLVDEQELSRRASLVPPGEDGFKNVAFLEAGPLAIQPRFSRDQVKNIFKFRNDSLARLRPALEADRSAWERFLVLQVSAREGMSMYPRLLPGAYMLLDRHYNSLRPYHRTGRNMYAVLHNARCYFRYAEQQGPCLALQAENPSYAPCLLPLAGKPPGDYIVGRIAAIYIET